MRAREFLVEEDSGSEGDEWSYTVSSSRKGHGKTTPHFDYVNPGAEVLDGMDKYYDFYRMSMLMAGDPNDEVKIDALSWIANAPFVSGYTAADMEKIHNAAKILKQSSRTIAPPGSREPPVVNKVSPVKAFKGYPR